MTRAIPQPRRRGGGAPKIDWAAAFAYFAADPTLGAREVAETYGVSESAVYKHIRAEHWYERRTNLLRQAAAATEVRILRTLEERQERTIKLIERWRDKLLAAPDDAIELEAIARLLPQYLRYEQLYGGEATDRVSLDEARAFVRLVLDTIKARLPEELVAEVEADLDRALGAGTPDNPDNGSEDA